MPFFDLPTEIRFQIYSHLLPPPGGYAYLYRSPSRHRRAYVTTAHLALVATSHLMRADILSFYFTDKTFVIEASLYPDPVGGLLTIPLDGFPHSWYQYVRKLVVLTVVEVGREHKVADLRPLQRMVGLREVRLLWTFPKPWRGSLPVGVLGEHSLRALRAVCDCVPVRCEVLLGADVEVRGELVRSLGGPSVELFVDGLEELENETQLAAEILTKIQLTQGRQSGLDFNHGLCTPGKCPSKGGCVNSDPPISSKDFTSQEATVESDSTGRRRQFRESLSMPLRDSNDSSASLLSRSNEPQQAKRQRRTIWSIWSIGRRDKPKGMSHWLVETDQTIRRHRNASEIQLGDTTDLTERLRDFE